jgi:hypothetical protein
MIGQSTVTSQLSDVLDVEPDYATHAVGQPASHSHRVDAIGSDRAVENRHDDQELSRLAGPMR